MASEKLKKAKFLYKVSIVLILVTSMALILSTFFISKETLKEDLTKAYVKMSDHPAYKLYRRIIMITQDYHQTLRSNDPTTIKACIEYYKDIYQEFTLQET